MTSTPGLRVAFQGEPGAYSEDAIQLLHGAASQALPCATAADAVSAVVRGDADRAMLPIENTIAGSVGETHSAIDEARELHAAGEVIVQVHHCLMAPYGASVEMIATVFSHALALEQCRNYFRRNPRMQTHGMFDAAGAAREVAQLGDPSFGAVAGRAAAGRHNLDILAADIEDRHDNQTRFISFAAVPAEPLRGTPVRTMMAFTTPDIPGSLLLALQPFARIGVNLRRIDTAPTGVPWSYRFFVEFDHEFGVGNAASVLQEVSGATSEMRVIGTFPRWNPGRRGSIGWTPMGVPLIAE